MLNSKKAQVAEAMTWVVATIIIIFILILFIYASSILGTFNYVSVEKLKYGESDLLNVKTELALGKNHLNEPKIKEWIGFKSEESLGEIGTEYVAAG